MKIEVIVQNMRCQQQIQLFQEAQIINSGWVVLDILVFLVMLLVHLLIFAFLTNRALIGNSVH
jgi:hypothetical protein